MKKSLLKAKESAYRLFNIRLRSEKELRDKLQTKSFSASIIDQTIDYFKKLELIDDRQFTQKWITSRLAKPFGISRIRSELKQKGITQDILDDELTRAQEDFPEDDIVLNLAKHRATKYKGIEPEKCKQRIYGYLHRRGFSSKAIIKAIRNL